MLIEVYDTSSSGLDSRMLRTTNFVNLTRYTNTDFILHMTETKS